MKAQAFMNNDRGLFLFRSLVILGLLLSFVGCRGEEEAKSNPEVPRNVRIMEILPGQLTEYFEISGPVAPVQGADLSAEEFGAVIALRASKGQMLKRGEIIVEQDRGILKAELNSATAKLEAESYNVDKVRKLNEAGKVSRMELLNTESQYEQSKSLVEVTGQRYERAAIRAPFDGIIVERYVELGQLLVPGQPVVRIIDPSLLKLEAYLTSAEVPWAQVGSQAEVKLGNNQGEVPGVVSWVGLEADRMTGKFKMELEIDNPDGKLRSGVIGRARIPKNVLQDIVAIPRDAVLHSRAGTSVFVVDGDRASRRSVQLGVDQGALVTVKSGLVQGDRLVVRGHRALRDSSLVSVTEVSTRRDGMIPGDPAVLADKAEDGR
jgi:membrane fusion protein, multidrug efflux system